MILHTHNPDQYMASLRQIIAQGRKRIGLIVGAGAPAGICVPGTNEPLIPAVAGLTSKVLEALSENYNSVFTSIMKDLSSPNIENILSRIRSLANVIGETQVYGLNGSDYKKLGDSICDEIGKIVSKRLPAVYGPYSELVTWISGTAREHAVEIFTTNYDLLFEEALERAKAPFFDGFTGASEPFFDPSSVANNDLPSRWTRLWKLHGSLCWKGNDQGEVVRVGKCNATHLVFPEHLKYDQTQKAPYAALFDRLRSFLMTPDTLLIASGFSFADAHISARIDECLSANPSASVFAFQFKLLDDETFACDIAGRRANMSVYSPDKAMINGVVGTWVPGDLPTRDWGSIRAGYWGIEDGNDVEQFLLGRFDRLARFFASSRSDRRLPTASPISSVESLA
ncbi:MAG: SIR2 family NAD-dependent protein deacylase [Solidesulfovibrio sp. DCME]|uniref:SIR2 family NAD-dependent protein deacylase n=1 Tax=Solidesulfovibrio sp. DCME TaxID=3447380 RepID=UPI003D0E4118